MSIVVCKRVETDATFSDVVFHLLLPDYIGTAKAKAIILLYLYLVGLIVIVRVSYGYG